MISENGSCSQHNRPCRRRRGSPPRPRFVVV